MNLPQTILHFLYRSDLSDNFLSDNNFIVGIKENVLVELKSWLIDVIPHDEVEMIENHKQLIDRITKTETNETNLVVLLYNGNKIPSVTFVEKKHLIQAKLYVVQTLLETGIDELCYEIKAKRDVVGQKVSAIDFSNYVCTEYFVMDIESEISIYYRIDFPNNIFFDKKELICEIYSIIKLKLSITNNELIESVANRIFSEIPKLFNKGDFESFVLDRAKDILIK